MLVYGLRILVALITFVAGVGVSRLTSSGCAKRPAARAVTTERVLVYQSPAVSETRECKKGLGRVEHTEADVVEGGILNNKAYSLPAPVYPAAAKSAGVGGTVYVRVRVDEGGRVVSASPLGGPRLLQEAAAEAALDATFTPTLLSGRPVRVTGVITYNFSLR